MSGVGDTREARFRGGSMDLRAVIRDFIAGAAFPVPAERRQTVGCPAAENGFFSAIVTAALQRRCSGVYRPYAVLLFIGGRFCRFAVRSLSPAAGGPPSGGHVSTTPIVVRSSGKHAEGTVVHGPGTGNGIRFMPIRTAADAAVGCPCGSPEFTFSETGRRCWPDR